MLLTNILIYKYLLKKRKVPTAKITELGQVNRYEKCRVLPSPYLWPAMKTLLSLGDKLATSVLGYEHMRLHTTYSAHNNDRGKSK